MSARLQVLAEYLRSQLPDLNRAVERAIALHAKAVRQGDVDYLDGVALNLHSFYMGVEEIFTRIARDVDESLPDGAQWHIVLLSQMTLSIPALRPQVISSETRHRLDEYRGFRHVVRNIYTFNLVPSKINELVANLPSCQERFVSDIEAFCVFLDAAHHSEADAA
jgi:hypothetical protein